MSSQARCPNMNHGKSNAPVNFCPSCGEKVRSVGSPQSCDSPSHAKKRKNGDKFCVDCGQKL